MNSCLNSCTPPFPLAHSYNHTSLFILSRAHLVHFNIIVSSLHTLLSVRLLWSTLLNFKSIPTHLGILILLPSMLYCVAWQLSYSKLPYYLLSLPMCLLSSSHHRMQTLWRQGFWSVYSCLERSKCLMHIYWLNGWTSQYKKEKGSRKWKHLTELVMLVEQVSLMNSFERMLCGEFSMHCFNMVLK